MANDLGIEMFVYYSVVEFHECNLHKAAHVVDSDFAIHVGIYESYLLDF